MIVPSTSDVVQTIATEFDEVIVPALQGLRERSCAATVSHLLSYVRRRVELEGPILFEEAGELRRILGGLAGRLTGVMALGDAVGVVRTALAQKRDPTVYPSIELLSAEVSRLRGAVDTMLIALRSLPEADRTEVTVAAHEELRAYLSWQIRQETTIVEPAFFGYGARR